MTWLGLEPLLIHVGRVFSAKIIRRCTVSKGLLGHITVLRSMEEYQVTKKEERGVDTQPRILFMSTIVIRSQMEFQSKKSHQFYALGLLCMSL